MIILLISGGTLYFYFQKSLIQSTEIRLMNSANNVLLEIVQNSDDFKTNPENFLFLTTKNEFTASGILVQFLDATGKVIVKSPGLKSNNLPFSLKKDQILSNIEFQDGVKIIVYQTEIIVNHRHLGYLVVGLPITQMDHYLSTLRNILIVVLILTLVILVLGINSLVFSNVVNNQKMFLSFASHELRTPLAVISGDAEIALQYEKTSEEYKSALRNIKEEADWMNRLVSNLLLIFRSNTGTERLTISNFHMGDLLIEATSALKKRYPKKKIILNLSEESQIEADQDRIRQVVNNLLENAAQNTVDDGCIQVTLSSNQKYFILEIKDNGKGIESKDLHKIFKMFYRIQQSKSTGTGLGLAISKWIVDRHKGKIFVKSIPNFETVFTVMIPKVFPRTFLQYFFRKF